jgi:hypothetical protein
VVFGVVAVGFLIAAVASQWSEVRDSIERVEWPAVVAALLALLAGLWTSMLAWRTVLSDLGSPLPPSDAARVFFLGQLGKYVPGSVWSFVAQMELGRGYEVPRARMLASTGCAAMLSVVTGLVVGLMSFPALFSGGGGSYALALLALPLFVVAVHPRVFNRAVTSVLRLLHRPPLEHALSTRAVVAGAGYMLLTWLFFGLQAVALAYSLGATGWETVPAAIGGFALAYTAGLLLIIAPAGLGVREAVIIATLGTVMTTADATALAVISRLLLIVADALIAGLAALTFVHLRRRSRSRGTGEPPVSAPEARATVPQSSPPPS